MLHTQGLHKHFPNVTSGLTGLRITMGFVLTFSLSVHFGSRDIPKEEYLLGLEDHGTFSLAAM